MDELKARQVLHTYTGYIKLVYWYCKRKASKMCEKVVMPKCIVWQFYLWDKSYIHWVHKSRILILGKEILELWCSKALFDSFTCETKADVMGETRAEVRAEVSLWKNVVKYTFYIILNSFWLGSPKKWDISGPEFLFLVFSKDGCSTAVAVIDMQNRAVFTGEGVINW